MELSPLDRMIATVAPSWAAKRMRARALMSRYYDAVESSTYRPRRGGRASADAVMQRAGQKPREFARWLDENFDLAIGVLDDLVSNIIGTGVGIEPMVLRKDGTPHSDFNDELRRRWAAFWLRPEVTQEIPGTEVERMICRSWLRDGEVFFQDVMGRGTYNYPTDILYALEPLESDFVPFDLVDAEKGIVHGVQKNAWGQPLGYRVFRQHPGDLYGLTGAGLLQTLTLDTKFIPAQYLAHLKFVRRFHQTRGVSIFHGVLTRMDDLKDYEASECVAARVAAALTVFISQPLDAASEVTTGTQRGKFAMESGMVLTGNPGEEPHLLNPTRPNPGLADFRSAMIRMIAAGTNTRYSAIARSYDGTYSAQRQELVEGGVHYRRLFAYLAAQFYLRVWGNFVDLAELSGAIRIPSGIMRESLYAPELRPPSLPWIDPLKEMNAYGRAIEIGVKSRWQCIRDLGGDPQAVDAQLTADPLDERAPLDAGAAPPQKPAAPVAPAAPGAEPAQDGEAA